MQQLICVKSLVFVQPFVNGSFYAIGPLSCLSVCLSCLSVTLMYCGQTVGWIKMKLVMEVGLGPGHIVLDGDPSAPTKRVTAIPIFAHVYCGQTVAYLRLSAILLGSCSLSFHFIHTKELC